MAIKMTRGMEHYSRAMLSSYEDRLRELGLLEEETTERGSDQCT